MSDILSQIDWEAMKIAIEETTYMSIISLLVAQDQMFYSEKISPVFKCLRLFPTFSISHKMMDYILIKLLIRS